MVKAVAGISQARERGGIPGGLCESPAKSGIRLKPVSNTSRARDGVSALRAKKGESNSPWVVIILVGALQGCRQRPLHKPLRWKRVGHRLVRVPRYKVLRIFLQGFWRLNFQMANRIYKATAHPAILRVRAYTIPGTRRADRKSSSVVRRHSQGAHCAE